MNVRRLMVARNNYAGTMMRFQIFDKWIKKVCPCGRGDVLDYLDVPDSTIDQFTDTPSPE